MEVAVGRPGDEQVTQQAAQDEGRVRLNIALYVVIVVCACAAVLVGAVLVREHWPWGDDAPATEAGEDVGRGLVEAVPAADEKVQRRTGEQLEAASRMVTSFVNISHEDPGSTIEAVKEQSTGQFLEQYTAGAESLRELTVKAESTMTAHVVWTGLVAGDEDSATVIVATNGTVKNKDTDFAEQARNYRIQLELVREGDRWLTSDLQFVALG